LAKLIQFVKFKNKIKKIKKERKGKKKRMGTYVIESLCCIAEMNTTLQINCTSI